VWTALLVTPYPIRASVALVPEQHRFPAAKVLHFLGYAGLAVLSGFLPLRPGWRWLLLALLSAHTCGTELAQNFVPERTPSWHDVTLNHTGLYAGLVLSWRKWCKGG
jgi:VanZ family protein